MESDRRLVLPLREPCVPDHFDPLVGEVARRPPPPWLPSVGGDDGASTFVNFVLLSGAGAHPHRPEQERTGSPILPTGQVRDVRGVCEPGGRRSWPWRWLELDRQVRARITDRYSQVTDILQRSAAWAVWRKDEKPDRRQEESCAGARFRREEIIPNAQRLDHAD